MQHVHINLIEFLITGCYMIVWGFLLRALAARWSENAAGKALGTII